MTSKEAIELLKRATMFEPTLENRDYPEAFDLAIKALEERPQGEWIEFADFVARNVVSEDFSEDVDFYAEVLCRKLVKLGLVKLEGNTYAYCGVGMRGDINGKCNAN